MFFNSLLASSLWGNITNYFANFSDTTNTCRTVFLWLALILAVAFIVCKFAVKKDYQPIVNKVSLIVAIVFSVASIVTFAVCSFIEDDIVAITFYPLLVFVICCIIGGLAIAVFPKKAVKIAVGATIAGALIAVLVCMIVYYASGDASDHNWITLEKGSDIGLYVSAVIVAVAIIVIAFLADKNKQPFDSKTIAFASICIALSFALSYVRILKMPMGGSITLASTLPIMLFSFIYGSRKGILAGLIYGALQAIQDPWILHPAQFLLDYGVAFAGIGLAGCIKDFGLFKNNVRAQFSLGAVIAGAFRFVSHFFSGAFAFGSYGAYYAEEYGISALSNPYVYSLVYQTMYVIPDLLIVIIVGVILFSSKNFVNQVVKRSNKKSAVQEADKTEESSAE
ncbi:MAG: energy-coupled thiamine transporter ThiT [Candidatus Coproplasma sp.]